MSRELVFIHGMFMNPTSWEAWQGFFTARGFRCHAPAWPKHQGDPPALRAAPPEGLGALTLGDVLASVTKLVAALPEKPAVIGHSMGGLVAQRLVAQGLVRAAACVDSAAPRGVTALSWSFLRSNLPVVNPLAGDSPFVMSPEHFRYTFCHTMSVEAASAVHARYVVPESRNVARSSGGADGVVDLSAPHAPLLFVAGELDHIIPSALNRKNHEAYTHAGSVCEFKEFAGRTHWICGQDGWEEVATFVADWIESR